MISCLICLKLLLQSLISFISSLPCDFSSFVRLGRWVTGSVYHLIHSHHHIHSLQPKVRMVSIPCLLKSNPSCGHCLASLNFTSDLILIKFKLSTSQFVLHLRCPASTSKRQIFKHHSVKSLLSLPYSRSYSAHVCSNWVYLSFLNLPIQAESSTTLNQYSRQVCHQTNKWTSLNFSISNNLTSKTRTQVSHPSNNLSFFQQTTNW